MGTLWKDLRYASRLLAKSPGFTLVAVAALALGIGANTAIFSVVNAVLLRPLPYEGADRLVRVGGTSPKRPGEIGTTSPQDFFDWRSQVSSFESVAAYDGWSPALTGVGEPERVNAARVSPGFFETLGVTPALGRSFLPAEEQRGQHRVVVLGDGLWRRRFGADPGIVGRRVELNGEPFEVVGVAPRGFESPEFTGLGQTEPPEMWAPFAPDLAQWTRDGRAVDAAVGRLREGVSEESARAELQAVAARLEQQYPETNRGAGATLASLQEQLVGKTRPALLVFLVAVGFVLLIACANVANLMLARTAARRKELAVRTALGATRWRLARQLLTESLLLALAGGALGLLLALWAGDALSALGSEYVPRLANVRPDLRVLLFTLGASVATGVAFGLFPALHSARLDPHEALKEGGREGGRGAARSRARSALVVAEVALSLALLVGAGLLAQSFRRLLSVDPGFRPEGALSLNIFLPGARYPEDAQHPVFFGRVVERVSQLPGVESAGVTSNLPVSGNFDQMPVYHEGHPAYAGGDEPEGERYMVGGEYFRALGVPLVAGRTFDEGDRDGAPRVAVVGRTLAEKLWPGGEAVGKRVKFGDEDNPWVTVVGVVGDVRHYGLDREANMQFYLHQAQYPSQFMTLVVRAREGAGDPSALAAAVRQEVWAVDKDQPVFGVRTMSDLVSDSVGQRRFNTLVVGLFAALALALAVVGVYGVMSYTVTQRTHEIGVRMALGASTSNILRLVVGQGMGLALAGVAVGLVAALALTRLMSGLLYGVSATDPATYASVALLLTAVALAACYVPARRATRVDPMSALRHE